MPSLPAALYRQHIAAESQRFRDVLTGCDPGARVPSCPDWDAADLLWHLTGVQDFWARAIRGRPEQPEETERDRPASYPELLAAFDRASADLRTELAATDPGEEAWTWSSDHSVGFVLRRQAHEALIHRLDAEQAAGEVTALDPQLAADGVAECLDVIFGGTPAWGRFDGLPEHVRVDLTDTGDRLWVQLGRFTGTDPDGTAYDEPDLHLVDDPDTEPRAVVSGPAAAVDTWLWHRADDSAVAVTGDPETYGRFRTLIQQPIN